MRDLVGSLRIRVRTQELQITGLPGKCNYTRSAHLLADRVVALRPQQLEVIVIDFLIAAGNRAAVRPLLALCAVGTSNKGRTVENAFLSALRLTVLTRSILAALKKDISSFNSSRTLSSSRRNSAAKILASYSYVEVSSNNSKS